VEVRNAEVAWKAEAVKATVRMNFMVDVKRGWTQVGAVAA